MKKIVKVTLFSLLFAMLFSFSTCAIQEKKELSEDMLGIDYNKYVAGPLSGDTKFHTEESAEKKADMAVKTLSISGIVGYFFQSMRDIFLPSVKTFAGVFAIIVLSAVFGALKESFGGVSEAMEYISTLCLAWYLFALMKPVIENVSTVIQRMSLFMVSLIPTMAALTASAGGQAQAGIGSTTTALILNYVQSVATFVIFPAAKAVFVLAVITAISEMVNLSGVTSFIKNACIWGIGLMMTLFTGILFFQSSVAAHADTLSVRGARFVTTSFIPVIGGMVGESMRTVVASVMLIKSITGMLGISAIVYFVIPPLCAILIHKMYLLVCAFSAKIIGLQKQSAFLYEINSALNILNALVIAVTLTFIVIVAVFINVSYSA
jgi:Stage III sporulation protein AE (spore_III_AE).